LHRNQCFFGNVDLTKNINKSIDRLFAVSMSYAISLRSRVLNDNYICPAQVIDPLDSVSNCQLPTAGGGGE